MRLVTVLAVGLATLVATASAAQAEIVVKEDQQGRDIRFDVRAANVNVDWYADVLADALHGDEITRLTIRIVPRSQVDDICGRGAAGSYEGSRNNARIVVPSGRSSTTAAILIHEYAHHIDRWRSVSGTREPNGTPAWWQAREIGELLANGEVARNYSLGWGRSIGEIFAEDYTQLHLNTRWQIRSIQPPTTAVLDALSKDLGGNPQQSGRSTTSDPLIVKRTGTIQPGERRTLPVELLGPNRRVTYTATVSNSDIQGPRTRMEVVCDQTTFQRPVYGPGED